MVREVVRAVETPRESAAIQTNSDKKSDSPAPDPANEQQPHQFNTVAAGL
jgi:hypothetical protein